MDLEPVRQASELQAVLTASRDIVRLVEDNPALLEKWRIGVVAGLLANTLLAGVVSMQKIEANASASCGDNECQSATSVSYIITDSAEVPPSPVDISVEPMAAPTLPEAAVLTTPSPKSSSKSVVIKPSPTPSATPTVNLNPERSLKPELPDRVMGPGEWLEHGNEYLENLPSLVEFSRMFPGNKLFRDPEDQLAHIDQLRVSPRVTVEQYLAFKMNMDYTNAFVGSGSYGKREIRPQAYVNHWTSWQYPEGVEQFIRSQRGQVTRSTDFFDRQGNGYQLFSGFNGFGAHAKGANLWTAGGEFETERYDPRDPNQRSPMFDITPEIKNAMVMRNVQFSIEMGYKPSRLRNVGHMAMDLIVRNPTYNPKTGIFQARDGVEPYVNKFDYPQEFIDMIVQDIQRLYEEVTADGLD